jgi:hypothetical protein
MSEEIERAMERAGRSTWVEWLTGFQLVLLIGLPLTVGLCCCGGYFALR